jgi:glycosyltransferase involved in cell wall biosynthesis
VTGTENYAIQLIRALIRLDTQHEIVLYFRDIPPANLFPAADRVTYRVIPFPHGWTHLRFAAELRRDRPDVTFVPAHTLPIFFPGQAVITVHDLGFKYFPQAHPRWQRWYLDWTTRYSAQRARVVLADSQTTADDLCRFYGITHDKVHVVYPGIDRLVIGDIGALRQKYRLPERYFLFVGTLQPRKNIARLVEAYKMWLQQNPDEQTGLVLAGSKGWLYDPAWTQDVDGIYLTGYVDDADKGALYAGALALVFPSLYEGFGFPVLEAMQCGTPVIASNTSSLPELVGEAGLLVDPLSVNAIVNALCRVSSEASLRGKLVGQGYVQFARFTWVEAARKTLSALELAVKR